MRFQRVAVIGASGIVGEELVSLLKKRHFPFSELLLFGSFARDGIQKLTSFKNIDLAFFAAGSSVSKEWIPKADCLCIDLSSYFRMSYPLIVPEINPHAIHGHLLSSPNCVATLLVMALFPLHKLFQAKRVIVSTYQAASGGGRRLMEELKEETKAYLKNQHYPHLLPFPYAFNLFPHNTPLHPSGYSEEEMKVIEETKKILEAPSLQISATCVRVPVLRAHSLSVNVEFEIPVCLDQVYQALKTFPGLCLFEDLKTHRFPTPFDASGKNEVFCGKIRKDPTRENTLEFWVVGDQLLKGAALNAVQIAEHLLTPSLFQESQ